MLNAFTFSPSSLSDYLLQVSFQCFLAVDIVKKPFFLLSDTSPAAVISSWALVFLVDYLQMWTALYSPCEARSCLQRLYIFFFCPSSSIVQHLHLVCPAYLSWTADNPPSEHSIHRTYSTKYHLYQWYHSSGKGPKFPVPPVCPSYCVHRITSIS